jgi:hypothetical protein
MNSFPAQKQAGQISIVKYGGDVDLNFDRSLNCKKSSFLVTGTATGIPIPVQYTIYI